MRKPRASRPPLRLLIPLLCLPLALFLAPAAAAQEEEPAAVTLTFRMGPYGTQTAVLEQGQYPSAQDVPTIPELPAAQVLGWYTKDGTAADPLSLPALEDTEYTARWSRRVADLLDTDSHRAYIQGSNHLFHPYQSLTRAEAAQMFYSLLRDTDTPKGSFPDVEEGKWYAEAAQTMAGLGIIQGKDGYFRPTHAITRAEFVTMAVACDTLLEGGQGPAFSDVPATSWAAPYIATAAAKGWIAGPGDGTFRPNEGITRAQAVTILNQMLGRSPDPQLRGLSGTAKFYDVFPDNWAYGQILEAAISHEYTQEGDTETWTDYERTAAPTANQWFRDGANLYYLDAASGLFLRGRQTIGGVQRLFDVNTGAAVNGFRLEDGYRRYYKEGIRLNDISAQGVVTGPYLIKVYKNNNYLIVYAKDDQGSYNTPVKAMRTSCGYNTPVGTFYTPARYRWLQMVGNTWAQWCTQITGNYLFHSVPNWTKSNLDLEVDEYNHLGETRSLGCTRLNCRDAKWLYDNCVLGTTVVISGWETTGPLPKPEGLTLPSWHTWDPTDPTAYWKCQQLGCH